MCTSHVSAFSFCLKKKTPAKEKQNRGNPPCTPPQRRAAVLNLWLSISCSAHSPANAPELERVRARASCFASRSALSKHSRLSPLERALCSLFFANIASLHPPLAGRFGDVARLSQLAIEHCGAAIKNLIVKGDCHLPLLCYG